MTDEARHANLPTRANGGLLLALAVVPLALLLLSLLPSGYGYFIDEFYYIACAKRLAFGYVDHPPLAPALLAAIRAVLGESVVAIRVPAFLGLSATVFVTGLVVRELGGGRLATSLAGLAVGLSPILLAMSGFFSMNVYEPLLWMLFVLTLIRIVRSGRSRLWLVAGALAGVAFQNKHTVVAFLAALAFAVVATPARRVLKDRWLWAGVALAAAIALPNVVWQVAHGWPSLEFYRNAHIIKNVPADPAGSVLTQMLVMNPAAAPVWIAGLVYLLFARDGGDLRFLGVAYLALLALHVSSQTGRPDRIAAAYPTLFAAGAVWFERGVHRLRASRPGMSSVIAAGAPAIIATAALVVAPGMVPLLPPAATAAYTSAIGLTPQAERGKSAPITQLLADRTGWESFVDDVARVYRALPAGDQARAVLYAPSYGQAGALELLGPSRGLPDRVIGSHNSYWHWSLGRVNTDVLIAVDAGEQTLRTLFAEVREAGRVRCDYCMNWRNDVPIYLARGSIRPVESVWNRARHYE